MDLNPGPLARKVVCINLLFSFREIMKKFVIGSGQNSVKKGQKWPGCICHNIRQFTILQVTRSNDQNLLSKILTSMHSY